MKIGNIIKWGSVAAVAAINAVVVQWWTEKQVKEEIAEQLSEKKENES